MKLYLSSYRIPRPDELFALVGKEARGIKLAIVPNAKDYYAKRAKDYKIRDVISCQRELGLAQQTVVDLLNYRDGDALYEALKGYDVIWVVGGNTFCLRQEMRLSGFDDIIAALLEKGVVYGGDSAGAVAAGTSLRGIESADIPEFAEEVIYDGLRLVPYVLLPHADNPEFQAANEAARRLHRPEETIELADNEAVLFDNGAQRRVKADR